MKRLLLLALTLSATQLFGQITFDPTLVDNMQQTANAANTVTTGDFDGDGDIDFVGGSFQSDYFSLYINDGTGNFTRNTIDNGSTADGARFAKAFDLDEDGDLDVLATSSTADLYLWYENDGSGLFSIHVIDDSAFSVEAYGIDAADFNNDGTMDIVGGANQGDALVIYANDGNENFLIHSVLSVGDNRTDGVRVVKAVDLDQDTDVDIVVAAFSGDTFSWYENDGNAVFTPHTIDDSADANGATAIEAADLDGDGDLDLAAGSNNANHFLWYENDGNENFTSHIIDNTSSYSLGPRGLALVDLEQDGDMDIVTAAITGDAFAWYENDGSGIFSGAIISNDPTYSNGAFAITTGDIDGDLVDDIVGAANISDAFSWFKTEGIVILAVPSNPLELIEIYPNPVADQLYISLAEGISEISIELYDSLGKLILGSTYSGDRIHELKTTSLPSGVYTLKLSTPENTTSRKFIKL